MKVFYDTEFLEQGADFPVRLISIGMVREDGEELYLVNADFRHWITCMANGWLRENVISQLPGRIDTAPDKDFPGEVDYWFQPNYSDPAFQRLDVIRERVSAFCEPPGQLVEGVRVQTGEKAELWAYYADYDHVVLSQLFGKMIDLPAHMPMYTHDLKQFMDAVDPTFRWKPQDGDQHHALADARWVAKTYKAVEALSRMTVTKL